MTDKHPSRKRHHQLPAGRHGLSRGYVERNQRERILTGVARAACDRGYPAMTVEDVITRSGVSRRTFYELFPGGKEEAFLAAYDRAAGDLFERVRTAYEDDARPQERVAEALSALLAYVAAEPAFAEMCLVQVLAAGPEAIARRDRLLKLFVAMVEESVRELPPERRPPPLTAETVIGGIYEVIYSRLLSGAARKVPEMLPSLLYATLLPYFGHDVALAEYSRRSS